MSLARFLTAVCLILGSANFAVTQEPFKSTSALAAKKSYEEAIAKAEKDYVVKLEIAIKVAGGAGHIDEANRLVAEKNRIGGNDPIEALRRRMIGTTWNNLKGGKNLIRFYKNHAGYDMRGYPFEWVVISKNTVVYQYPKQFDLTIYMMHIDDKFTSASGHIFNKHSSNFSATRVR